MARNASFAEMEDIEGIGAALCALQRDGKLDGDGEQPVRLYCTRQGDFVQVLDDDAAPLTPAMLRAIDVYMERKSKYDERGGADAVMCEEKEETATSEVTTTGSDVSVTGEHGLVSNEAAEDSEMRGEADIAMEEDVEEPRVDHRERRDDRVVEEATPMELMKQGVDPSAWLTGEEDDTQAQATRYQSLEEASTMDFEMSVDPAPAPPPIRRQHMELEMLIQSWPRRLTERTRVCILPSQPTSGGTGEPSSSCIVYWLRTTFRVRHGNFGLAVALQLGKQHDLPVIAVSFLPPSIKYPVRHAATMDDALTRWSVVEVRRHLRELQVEMFAFTLREPCDTEGTTSADAGSALHEIFNAFRPAAVVVDDGYSLHTRIELDSLRQFMQTRVRTRWSLLAVDSSASVPFQSQSECIRKSLDVETARFLSEDAFSNEYNRLTQQQLSEDALPVCLYEVGSNGTSMHDHANMNKLIKAVMTKLQIDEVNWKIVEAMNSQASKKVKSCSETAALEHVEALLNSTDDRPAIQQELQGSGILSLLPFIRHGTLFSGKVMERVACVIKNTPRPTDGPSRKAFAALKVLQSRATAHLARGRDYALYLSLWAARHAERDLFASGRVTPFRSIASFMTSTSELDTLRYILPSWVSPNTHLFGGECRQTPTNDPYQLESARSDDQYWNDIQLFILERRYLHPLVVTYWVYRILEWSISTRAGVATVEALLNKCCLGVSRSPDTLMSVWIGIFQLGSGDHQIGTGEESSVEFVRRMEVEANSQQKLQLRK